MSQIEPRAMTDGDKEFLRATLEIEVGSGDFAERYAAYRNALNVVEKKRGTKRWTRKYALELFVELYIQQVREQMATVFEKFGPLPPANDEKAVLAYARAVLEATEKTKKR